MLYYFFSPLRELFFGFNVFRYITFRAALAGITAFLISLWIGPAVIRALSAMNLKQSIEREGFSKLYEAHASKKNVPTMGGVLILSSLVGSTLLWADLSNRFVLLSLGTLLWLGLVGFADDAMKLLKKDSKGLKASVKMACQLALSLALGLYLYFDHPAWRSVDLPFMKDYFLALGPFYVFFVIVVITGASNAVNLTDGLDGLAIGCTLMVALTYAVLAYVSGHADFSRYLQIPFIPGAGELAVVCAALFGAGMGFLWFNSHPASLFMGDMGSLSLGGMLGVIALLIKKELLLVIVGGIFVLEAVSVLLQVGSYKFRKKRIFLMAPIHHHFQLQGLSESKVVIRFWIVSIILSLVGLASLKLR